MTIDTYAATLKLFLFLFFVCCQDMCEETGGYLTSWDGEDTSKHKTLVSHVNDIRIQVQKKVRILKRKGTTSGEKGTLFESKGTAYEAKGTTMGRGRGGGESACAK